MRRRPESPRGCAQSSGRVRIVIGLRNLTVVPESVLSLPHHMISPLSVCPVARCLLPADHAL